MQTLGAAEGHQQPRHIQQPASEQPLGCCIVVVVMLFVDFTTSHGNNHGMFCVVVLCICIWHGWAIYYLEYSCVGVYVCMGD